jgi:chromosome partitioning protein
VRTLAVTNQKGGSGKTTSAVNVAAALGEKGRRVLLVDLDSQASASSWLGVKDGGKGLLEVFSGNGSLVDIVVKTDVPGVDLVPSSAWMVGAERALASEVGAETIFRRAVQKLPKDRWDYVFVDCPPALGLLVLSALTACREVFVPVEASTMALSGLASLLQTVDRVKERLNPDLRVAAILACRVDYRTNLSKDVVDRLRERFGNLVLETVIRENVRLREAWSFSKPITSYETNSAGAEDYRAAAAELSRKGDGSR